MKDYLLGLYQNVGVSHSFVEDSQMVDCVPLLQQPGLRGASAAEVNAALAAGLAGPGAPITEPPVPAPQLKSGPAAPGETRALDLTLPRGERDVFGNSISCARGSIPMRRITLDEMVRFPTLEEFLQGSKVNQGPLDVRGGGQNEIEPANLDPHYWARGDQVVDNFGGDAWLNVWSPSVSPHQMSLSQLWVVAGDGDNLQTVEAGWQVYPDKWGTDRAVLFIFLRHKITKLQSPRRSAIISNAKPSYKSPTTSIWAEDSLITVVSMEINGDLIYNGNASPMVIGGSSIKVLEIIYLLAIIRSHYLARVHSPRRRQRSRLVGKIPAIH
jgi:hypothetical protein